MVGRVEEGEGESARGIFPLSRPAEVAPGCRGCGCSVERRGAPEVAVFSGLEAVERAHNRLVCQVVDDFDEIARLLVHELHLRQVQ